MEVKWSASSCGRCSPAEIFPNNHWIGARPQSGLLEKEKNLFLVPGIELRFFIYPARVLVTTAGTLSGLLSSSALITLDFSITQASSSVFILPKFSPAGCSTKQYRSWLHFLKQCVTRITTASALRCASVRGTTWLGFIMWSKDRKYILSDTLQHA